MARKKSNFYKVPESDLKDYKLLVQQANRQVKRNLKYLEDNNITSLNTTRSLAFNYQDKENWITEKTVFSRATKFESRQDYQNYIRHLEKMAGARPKELEKDYRATIVDRLQRTANIWGIDLPDNKISDDLIKEVNEMNLEQLQNWFEIGDPEEDIEVSQFGSDDYFGVSDYEDFRDVTLTRIGWLKKTYKKK